MEEVNVEQIETLCADRSCSVETIIASIRRFQTHEINQNRAQFSEYYRLFPLLKKYNDKFRNYTRMTVNTFDYILGKVNDHLQKNWCNFHQPIIPEEKLVISIRLLASGSSYSDLAFSFRIGESTVCTVVNEVLEVLWRELCSVHMPIPSTNRLLNIAQDFYSIWNVPHCIGAIDGCHIPIRKPPKSGKSYFNYKKFFSIVLQGVVDAHYKFICVDVGGFGSHFWFTFGHDATTYRNSTFYAALNDKTIQVPEEDKLPNSQIILPYFFVADGAYPLGENLLKPYPGKELPENKKVFNKRLSRGRAVVECAFGKLFQTWRIFYTTIQQLPKTVELIVKAACILHNVILDLEGDTDTFQQPESLIFDEENDTECSTSNTDYNTAGLGQEVRDELTKYFMEHPL